MNQHKQQRETANRNDEQSIQQLAATADATVGTVYKINNKTV